MADVIPVQGWRLAVLHGGPSSEHDISVLSANHVLTALRGRGHEVHAVWVDRQGLWYFGGTAAAAGQASDAPLPLPAALGRLVELAPDAAFLGFHGTFGEDGRVQAALDLAGVPFTGSAMTASAVGMDKPMARRLLAAAGLHVPPALDLPSSDLLDDDALDAATGQLITTLGLPVVIKVSAGGSSLGIEIAPDQAAVRAALARLRHLDDVLLCEAHIAGIELTAGVLQESDGQVEALPIVEIAPQGERWFDYEAKYDPALTQEIVPARIPADVEQRAREAGRVAHLALGCRGVSRTDMILDGAGRLMVLEINTLPGLTPASLLPKAAAAAGCEYPQMLERIVAAACARASAWGDAGKDSP